MRISQQERRFTPDRRMSLRVRAEPPQQRQRLLIASLERLEPIPLVNYRQVISGAVDVLKEHA